MLDSLRIIMADKAHELGFFGRGVLVGVADTGIDPKYLGLHRNLAAFKDFTGAGILDRIGHGTAVAALMCSPEDDYLGVAPETRLAVARCIGANGAGTDYEIINACEWLASKKVNVINLSLGGKEPATDNDPLCREVNVLNRRGIVVAIAAGNRGPYPMTISAPGAASGAITVGATDKRDMLASFSSRGPTKDQRAKPDCVATGVNIVIPALRHIELQLWSMAKTLQRTARLQPLESGFLSVSGTSFATPLVAGSAALLLEALKDAPGGIRTRLLENCDPVKGEEKILSKRKKGSKKVSLPAYVRLRLLLNSGRYKWGCGRINVWKSLRGVEHAGQ